MTRKGNGTNFPRDVRLHVGETTEDGAVTLLRVSCIGLSDQPPSALINTVPFTNLKPEDVGPILEGVRRGEKPSHLPQAGAHISIKRRGEVLFAPYQCGAALRAPTAMEPEEVIREIAAARLRGHGGAGFPTAMKWSACRRAQGEARYVVCNADEGEQGAPSRTAPCSPRPPIGCSRA